MPGRKIDTCCTLSMCTFIIYNKGVSEKGWKIENKTLQNEA